MLDGICVCCALEHGSASAHITMNVYGDFNAEAMLSRTIFFVIHLLNEKNVLTQWAEL